MAKHKNKTMNRKPVDSPVEVVRDLKDTSSSDKPNRCIKELSPDTVSDTTFSSRKHSSFNRRGLLILLAVMSVMLFFIMKMFFVPVILAFCFTTLFNPLYTWFLRVFKKNSALSSIACCCTLFFGLMIPVYMLFHMISLEFINFYGTAEPLVRDLVSRSDSNIFSKLRQYPIFDSLNMIQINWQSLLISALKSVGNIGTAIINKTSTELLSLLFTVAVMFFTMFYLFIDGEKLLKKLQYLSPLRQQYDEMLFKRFLMISRATIRGTILIGLAQGSLGALTFLAVGIKSWLLWGFVMVMFSLIPFTGVWMVMLPAAVLQLIYGHYWKAAIIALMCILVVSTIDNILRPRLVGSEAKMHDLLVFFSTIGGIAVYGIMGFIIGPVIAALFIALLDMYGIEYGNELKS